MLKKIVSGALATGMILASVSAFACNCGEQYRTYECGYVGNDQHHEAYRCSYRACDDPFTDVGIKDCTYEWVRYEDPMTWDMVLVQQCTKCGHIKE